MRLLTDKNAATLLDQLTYDSYGNILSESSPATGDRFKYAGREWDAELGLYTNRARDYNPSTGRFLSEDPSGLAAGDRNLYRYVGNQPTGATDPFGLQQTFVSFDGSGSPTDWRGHKRASGRDILDLPDVPGSSYKDLRNQYFDPDFKDRTRDAEKKIKWLAAQNMYWTAGAGFLATPRPVGFVPRRPPKAEYMPSAEARTRPPKMSKLQPDPNATGPHTVFKRDPTTGEIKGYETYRPQTNPRNRNPWESVQRTDLKGKPHFNKKTGQDIPTPHVHDPAAPGGVRRARPDEIPRGG